jgi:hypothetical protein
MTEMKQKRRAKARRFALSNQKIIIDAELAFPE